MMRAADQLLDNMEFQLSLLRLMTAPHQPAGDAEAYEPEGAVQLERLFQLAGSGYRN